MTRRVAVTGLGVVSSLGLTRAEHFQSLKAGRSGIGPLTITDADRLSVKIGAYADDFTPDADADYGGINVSDISVPHRARRILHSRYRGGIQTVVALFDRIDVRL